MRIFTFIAFLAILSMNFARAGFIPENDLWMEDCLDCKSSSGVDEATFGSIIDTAYTIYKEVADQHKEQLVINKFWEFPWVNAFAFRGDGTLTINMFGGMARRQEMTAEGFTLVLCHELSHAYGQAPYMDVKDQLSAEGQADYMATYECAKKIFKELELPKSEIEATDYMVSSCKNDTICISSLVGAQSLANLMASLFKLPVPNFTTPDPTIVTETNLSYPDTNQCRIDTLFNGAVGKERPLCWYKP